MSVSSPRPRLSPAVGLALVVAVASAGRSAADTIVGVTSSNRLITFNSAAPGTPLTIVNVSGLMPGENLVGVDFRPATPGTLVGVGQRSDGSGAVYLVSGAGTLTQINTIPTLTGTSFGVDFNPVPNALRIVSDANQNLRITAGGGGVVNPDTALNPANLGIGGAAYSNNFAGTTTTTLYDIGVVNDQLYIQGAVAPPGPNGGVLTVVGPLGVDATGSVGFDIVSDRIAGTNTAFATLNVGGVTGLYSINLATGQATPLGSVGGLAPGETISGISVQQEVPEPATLALVGVGVAGLALWRRRRP